MPRPEVLSEENIVRAIHKAWWDEQENRKESSIFKGQNISVSRLSILNLDELFVIFHKQLDTSPNGVIIGAGEINVRQLKEVGRNFTANPTELTVEVDPIKGDAEKRIVENPAHAEIPQKISRGLANKIIDELIFHRNQI